MVFFSCLKEIEIISSLIRCFYYYFLLDFCWKAVNSRRFYNAENTSIVAWSDAIAAQCEQYAIQLKNQNATNPLPPSGESAELLYMVEHGFEMTCEDAVNAW